MMSGVHDIIDSQLPETYSRSIVTARPIKQASRDGLEQR